MRKESPFESDLYLNKFNADQFITALEAIYNRKTSKYVISKIDEIDWDIVDQDIQVFIKIMDSKDNKVRLDVFISGDIITSRDSKIYNTFHLLIELAKSLDTQIIYPGNPFEGSNPFIYTIITPTDIEIVMFEPEKLDEQDTFEILKSYVKLSHLDYYSLI